MLYKRTNSRKEKEIERKKREKARTRVSLGAVKRPLRIMPSLCELSSLKRFNRLCPLQIFLLRTLRTPSLHNYNSIEAITTCHIDI